MSIREENEKVVEDIVSQCVLMTTSDVMFGNVGAYEMDAVKLEEHSSAIFRLFSSGKCIAFASYSFMYCKKTGNTFFYPVWQWTHKDWRNKGLQKTLLDYNVVIYCEKKIPIFDDGKLVTDIKLQYCSCFDSDNPWWAKVLKSYNCKKSDINCLDGYPMKFTAEPSKFVRRKILDRQEQWKREFPLGILEGYVRMMKCAIG